MRFNRIWLGSCNPFCLLVIVALPLIASSAGLAAPPCDIDFNPGASTISKCRLELEGTEWKTHGGIIAFTIVGLDTQKHNVAAYLRFGPEDPQATNKWSGSRTLTLDTIRVGENKEKNAIIFNALLPPKLNYPNVSDSLYPEAQLRVIVFEPEQTEPAKQLVMVLDTIRDIQFARRGIALLMAALFVVVTSAVLYCFSLILNVPGTRVLRIISTAGGYASLAQFQIILWTLVIGAGAIYVMALRGSLIPISEGALELLGITGLAMLGSQLKTGQQAQPVPMLVPPGSVNHLGPEDLTESELTLSWEVPSGGGTPGAYTVQYREDGTVAWMNGGIATIKTRFRLAGLKPDTLYDLQVIATNPAGNGPSASIQVHTAAAPAGPLPALAISGLHRQGEVKSDSISLGWLPVAGARYTVEYRRHNSDDPWHTFSSDITSSVVTVTKLEANTLYDFQVSAATASPSAIFRETTGPRKPRWSDIVTDTDRPAEIDVTRVQMLFFTVISAFFVSFRIAYSDAIPEIPTSYVTLMGISNGVYVGSKFIGH